MKPLNLLFLVATFVASTAYSQVQISSVSASGSGCPDGTVSAVTSPDATTLSVLFDNFIVESQNNQIIRKTCAIKFKLLVNSGYQVQFINADYRGAEILTETARSDISSTITATYILKTPKGQRIGNAITPVKFSHWNEGPFDGPIFMSQASDFPSWAPCGKEIFVTAEVAASVRSPFDLSMVFIDSTDITADARQSLSLGMAVRKCK